MGNTSKKTQTCKFCNKNFEIEFEHTQQGFGTCQRVYCSNECKSAKKREKTNSSVHLSCSFCHKNYTLPPSLAKQSKYCSRECQNQSQAKQSQKNREVLQCIVCSQSYEEIVGRKRKYCSLECAKVGSRTAERILVACEMCAKEFEKYATSPIRFCGRKCQYAAQSCGKIRLFSGGRSGVRSDLGSYFRSALEADYARFCNHIGVKFLYEHQTFKVAVSDSETVSYTPDFYHPETQEFVELKAGRKDRAYEKNLVALDVLKKNGLNIRVIYMKAFYDELKAQELFNVISNLESRNYKGTKHLVIN